ncbi:MAG: hypothetical protein M3Q89_11640 [Verrucomicrobiota bacterium]|nr:hypothetical protein [Verrucomicrobiota bacterium]
MNWEAIGAIANLLAALGVIATLIYLAIQIRQNNNQLRGSATIAVYDYQRSITDTLTEDQELYKIALCGNEDLDSLNPWEQQRFTIWAIKETGAWEMCHRLMKQGALDEGLYRGKEAYWLLLHSSPGRRTWWHRHAIMLNKEFVDEVSKQLEKIPVKKLREEHPIFDSSVHAAAQAKGDT